MSGRTVGASTNLNYFLEAGTVSDCSHDDITLSGITADVSTNLNSFLEREQFLTVAMMTSHCGVWDSC